MTREAAEALVAALPDLRPATVKAMVEREMSMVDGHLARYEVSEILWAVAHAVMKRRKLEQFAEGGAA